LTLTLVFSLIKKMLKIVINHLKLIEPTLLMSILNQLYQYRLNQRSSNINTNIFINYKNGMNVKSTLFL